MPRQSNDLQVCPHCGSETTALHTCDGCGVDFCIECISPLDHVCDEANLSPEHKQKTFENQLEDQFDSDRDQP
jgi:predicted nucleic acid binding AN1-type Zn finger protein